MKTSAFRNGTLKNQPNKMGTTPQHIYKIPTSCAILPTTLFVSCVHSRVVEGSWEGIAGCTLHVDVHGEFGICNVVARKRMFLVGCCSSHGYKVSSTKKADVSNAILESSSEHTQNTAVYTLMTTAKIAVETSAFF